MSSNTVISFVGVGAKYESDKEILSDVSFNISKGSFYFLSGMSGAGKTTLLKLIYGLFKQSRGQIKLFGKSISDSSHDQITELRKKMSIVFQEYSLLSHLTVFDNVALPLRVRNYPEHKVKELVNNTLEWVGLSRFAENYPKTLSGGQQQRISVARAIIVQPDILLADEPTGNLDDKNASKLMELFVQMNKKFGTTVIIATHSLKIMSNYKFPTIIIEDGKVSFTNRTEETTRKTWKGPKPQNYFAELSERFDKIAENNS